MKEIILAGRPNSGKSSLFNRIASQNQKVANYAGCTVEKKSAVVNVDGNESFLATDLPGIYSLNANSLDEEVALKHLRESKDTGQVLFVVDGNNLEQELVLPLLLKSEGHSVAIGVNMMDEVRLNKRILDLAKMEGMAGIPFFPLSARTGEGVESLVNFLSKWERGGGKAAAEKLDFPLAKKTAKKISAVNSKVDKNFLLNRDQQIDRWLVHPAWGPVVFLAVMFFLFQSIFTWAAPLSDGIEGGIGALQALIKENISVELLASLLSDGLLAGIGAVLVFVPQIAILFFLIGVLEYSGYLPRVSYMVDRLLKPYGLDGKVFIPLLSSVACAVPGIMATRTIESEKRRLITIMISPLMTCSARLPVYTLLISTFVPARSFGPFSLPGLVMFAMYAVAVVIALVVAFVLHKFSFQDRKHVVDIMSLPHYRLPNWQELFRYVWMRVALFLKKAGTIIASMAILLWALLTFPQSSQDRIEFENAKSAIQSNTSLSKEDREAKESEIASTYASKKLEHSIGGYIGKGIEPIFTPIGYDWKLTIGVLSSLAAREVFVSTIGTVFSLGEVDENSHSLMDTLQQAKGEDGLPKYTLATCVSLLLFFAFSLQCVSTIGVAKRESNSWKIPTVMFVYMFALAYLAALIGYQATKLFI